MNRFYLLKLVCAMYKCNYIILMILALGTITKSGFAQADICKDYSPHIVRMVEVESDVHLEVLDWGGGGESLVFLSGNGDTGHVFDNFIIHFSPYYRVISITRRGFGNSSWPRGGYDTDTRAHDIVKVLDSLNIQTATFIGHSIAGDELSKLGAAFPERTARLIYLDAYNYEGGEALQKISTENPLPPSSTTAAPSDSLSLLHLQAFNVRQGGVRVPIAELCEKSNIDSSGHYVGMNRSEESATSVWVGTHHAELEKITSPTLGIFSVYNDPVAFVYDYADRPQEIRNQIDRTVNEAIAWRNDQIEQYRTKIPGIRIVELTEAHHYLFISNELRVVREMMRFLNE